jgi:hypothetical protein
LVPAIETRDRAALVERFDSLSTEWKTATSLLSSTTAMLRHPAYQAIIALGMPVVPLLLGDFRREPAHWFEALEAITGDNPVPLDHRGDIRAMADDWLAWGRNQGLI